jgi:predicted CXXCH cytochrome family protein
MEAKQSEKPSGMRYDTAHSTMAAVGQYFSLPRVLSTAALLLLAITLTPRANSRQAENQSEPYYVGAQACAGCHADVNHEWLQSRHSKMVQPATPQGVVGDFSKGVVELRGSKYTLEKQGSGYYITEDYLRGTPWKHKIEYTLGNRRIQHYLTTLPDGRIILMPATWDNVRKQWFHNGDINDPEEAPGVQIQLWNKTCYSCHVSGEEKHFDLRNETYHTNWQNFGISCERCHGPGSEHVAWAEGAGTLDPNTRAIIDATIVNFKQMTAMRSTMVCAQCHSFRDIYVDGFRAGANYFDYFMPVMQYRLPDKEDPAYWADGRTRRFSNDAFGLWQSQCFLKGGATCGTCHSRPHNTNVDLNAQLRPTNNALCTNCHGEIGKNVAAHTHHAVKSTGSSCVECHMPRTVLSIKAQIRDHSMSVPAPENTINHDIPNACNDCHNDKDAKWAVEQMNQWWGDKGRQKLIDRANAFAAAHNSDPAAVPALLRILTDPSGGPLVRGNAAGYLGNFPADSAAYEALLHAFKDPEPLVRATAVLAIKPHPSEREAVFAALVGLLNDEARTVQLNAAIGLVAMGIKQLPGEEGARFERAKAVYRARAELNSDDPEQDLAAGKFFFLAGDLDHSAMAFRAAIKLDQTLPAQYFLARVLVEKRDFKAARDVLQTISYNDPQYPAAQRLLAEIASAETADQPTDASDAQARFNSGQLLYRTGNFGGALKDLDDALRQAPDAAWVTKAQVYRAVCLVRLGRVPEAEAAMKVLSGKDLAGDDLDVQVALIELLSETGRVDEALKRAAELVAAYPRNGVARFWHAKLLLQVHQPEEAVKAAEESVRLLPDYAAAHNLLIRIYQMQGRTKEAALQAEWLRDYQRRNESH